MHQCNRWLAPRDDDLLHTGPLDPLRRGRRDPFQFSRANEFWSKPTLLAFGCTVLLLLVVLPWVPAAMRGEVALLLGVLWLVVSAAAAVVRIDRRARPDGDRTGGWPRDYAEQGAWRTVGFESGCLVCWALVTLPPVVGLIRAAPAFSPIAIVPFAGGVTWFSVRALRASSVGRLRVRFEPCSVAPGDHLVVRLGFSDDALPARYAVLRLASYIERPRFGMFPTAETYLQTDHRWELYGDQELPEPGGEIELVLAVPRGPSTELDCRVPTYWELDVHVETSGPRYMRRFLVPVYAVNDGG